MPSWEQDFDFYMAAIDDKPASFVLDLAAEQHAPLDSHPLLLEIRVPLLRPRPDGLRDASELDDMGALEDQFVDALEEKVGAIYAGRVVHDGNTSLYLYVGEEHREALDGLPELTGDPPGDYEPQWAVMDDPEWRPYLQFLAPDDYARQTIWNRRLLAQFSEHGDATDLPRTIDHLAYFPSQEAADQAATALAAAGFAIDPVEAPKDDDGGWAVSFHRDDKLADGRPDEFCGEILDIILPLEGGYDGWGAPHVAKN